ncbi:MAG: stage II sporulation protein D [Terrisporobacter sp.]|uniref:stage II sporulation protein D n=1 Tax=Terrisporobacter sp. TaxID=1965305 RepID=UPI002FCC4E06
MKKPLIFVFSLFLLIVSVSILGTLLFYKDNGEQNVKKNSIKTEERSYEAVNKKSPKINVYDVDNQRVMEMDMEEYLYGVLSSEMPSTFDIEALKAQAIAARTYVIYKKENNIIAGHSNATVCTNSSHCQAYTSYDNLKKIKGNDWIKGDYLLVKQAVDDTKGQIITYDQKAILPLYFSTSSGKTENSKDVFSTEYPYLKSVDSPYEEESPKYNTTYSIKKYDFIKTLKSSYKNINISSNNLESQMKIINRTQGGCVKTIQIGNIKIAGTEIRKILKLNSANFDINCKGDNVNFAVKGYGHGVGMSQWGAQGMAKEGYKYYDILMHYYKDTEIKDTY